MNCEIDGVKYVSAPDRSDCSGCVAENDTALCQQFGYVCCSKHIIWMQVKPELTDDEILEICDKFGWEQGDWIKCIRAAIEADRATR